jgi:hypothetical protein
VLPAPRVAALATMVLSATEGAAQITAARAARMSEEANPAVAAVHRAGHKIGMIPQDRIERQLILTNKRISAVVLVPIFAKRENFRDGYKKIARLSVKMLICFCMSLSYLLDAKASRGRAGIFYALVSKSADPIRTDDLTRKRNADARVQPVDSNCLCLPF